MDEDSVLKDQNGDDWDASTCQLSQLFDGAIISSPFSLASPSSDDESFDSLSIGGPNPESKHHSGVIFTSNVKAVQEFDRKPNEFSGCPGKGEMTTVTTAIRKQFKMRRDPAIYPRPSPSTRARQRPNCLFLNHMGSRPSPGKVTGVSARNTFRDLEDELFDFPNDIFDDTPLDLTLASGSLSEHRPSSACPESPIPDDVSFQDFSDPFPSPSQRAVNATDSPRDIPLDDLFVPFAVDDPTDSSMDMAPALPVGAPTDSPVCYPSESPSRISQVINVGNPTDLVCLPSIDDPEGAEIGVVSPETTPCNAAQAPKTKVPPRRKARSVYSRRTATANTLEAQYWRQSPVARRSIPQIPALAYTGHGLNPRPHPLATGWATHRPYRRSYGLSPMPYALVSPSSNTSTRTYPSRPQKPYSISTMRPRTQPHPW